MPARAALSSPSALAALGRGEGGGVWVHLPVLAPSWLPGWARRLGARLRRLAGRSSHRSAHVEPATVGVGLAVHDLAQFVLAGEPGARDALDGVLARWLPEAVADAVGRLPAAEAVATTLRLLDGTPDGTPETDDPPGRSGTAPEPDWLLSLQRFADASGTSLAEVLTSVPWRAFPAEALRAEILRATRLRDAALAAASGMNGGDATTAILDAVEAAYEAAGLRSAPPTTPEASASARPPPRR